MIQINIDRKKQVPPSDEFRKWIIYIFAAKASPQPKNNLRQAEKKMECYRRGKDMNNCACN